MAASVGSVRLLRRLAMLDGVLDEGLARVEEVYNSCEWPSLPVLKSKNGFTADGCVSKVEKEGGYLMSEGE